MRSLAFRSSRAESTTNNSNGMPSIDQRRVLSRARARCVYDRMGLKANDTESAYGGPATELLVKQSRLNEATDCVVEFGHGSGSFARRLFARQVLSPTSKYVGVDQSSTMADLAQTKLEPYQDRIDLRLSVDGSPSGGTRDLESGTVDRFISTYVFDLLSEDDICDVLAEARRLLKPDGLLCLSGITYGNSISSWLMATLWQLIYWYNIEIVGGCRPQRLVPYLEAAGFDVQAYTVIQGDRKSILGFMNNEVVIARPPDVDKQSQHKDK